MKFASRYLVAAALVAAPIFASAQTTPPPAAQGEHAREGREFRGQRGPGGGSPVQRLLSQRERLKLTDAQVQRLQAIDRDLQARNAPLQQQLASIFPERAERARGAEGARPRGERRARPDGERRQRGERPQLTDAQRQQMQQRRAQAEPVMQQLRQNSEAALTEARAVLTAEQQAQVNQWRERRGERGEDRRGERDGRREGRRGDRGASQSR
jgi:Spy/CpxP family protein refolding chaperone